MIRTIISARTTGPMRIADKHGASQSTSAMIPLTSRGGAIFTAVISQRASHTAAVSFLSIEVSRLASLLDRKQRWLGMLWMVVCTAWIVGVGSLDLRSQTTVPPPQFRSSADLARLDVAVLNDSTRQSIHGLTASDFVVKVDGRERAVLTVAESVFESKAPSKGGVQSSDVVTNAPVRGRIFVILMDDALAEDRPSYVATAKRIGHAVVDSLSADDRAGVIFAQSNQHAVDFTDNRDALRRAIDTYRPLPLKAPMAQAMSRDTLQRSRQLLDSMPGYRRAIVLVTSGAPMARDSWWRTIGGVPVYIFRVNGLRAPGGGGPAENRPDPTNDALRVLAGESGGRAFLDTNTPFDNVVDMFNELSSFYTLGFEGQDVKDGAWTTVSVRRRGAEVVPSGFDYHSPESRPAQDSKSDAVSSSSAGLDVGATRHRPTGLLDALAGPLPMGDLRLTLSAIPVATAAREAAVVVTVGFTPPPQASAGDAYGVELRVFDGEGLKQIHIQNHTIHVPAVRSGEILLRVPLRPGRYNLRLSFQHEASKIAGSVYAPSVVVPEFGKTPLTLSGLIVGHQEGAPIGGRQVVSELLPFAPTAVRTFASSDHVRVMMRAYQRPGERPASAVLDTTIADETGATVVTAHEGLDASKFSAGASEYLFDIPMAKLKPGSFVLRIVATIGKQQAERSMKFTVRSDKSGGG